MSRVSHEIRTPLNAVIGFCDVMHQELLGPIGHSRYREYVHHIRDSGADLLKVAEDTLAMTSLVADPRLSGDQAVRLGAVAREAIERVSVRSDLVGAEIAASLDGTIEVRADHRALRQALVNLLTAALRRCRPGARIVVEAMEMCTAVRLVVTVDRSLSTAGETDLPICLARTLLELQGLSLVETARGGTWQAATILDAVLQRDFFGTEAASA
jgi:two-component system cell cycle sensor histidine kinase PleC